MNNEIDNRKSKPKLVLGNNFIWHKRKHKEIKENCNSKTNLGITEKRFKINHSNQGQVGKIGNSEIKSISYHTCYYSPISKDHESINKVNSCKLKEFTNPKHYEIHEIINPFSSEFKQENEHPDSKLNCTRMNNFKKKIKSSEQIILEEMSRFKFTAQPLKKSLFYKSKFKAKSCSHFVKEKNEKIKKNNPIIPKTIKTKSKPGIKIRNKTVSHSEIMPTKSLDTKASYFKNLLKNVHINTKEHDFVKAHPINTLKIKEKLANDFTSRKKEDDISQIKNSTNNTEINPLKSTQNNFKARVLPNFTYIEVKKSNKSLTVPKSPELKTKDRSKSKLKQN